jgi:hypothetical protein
VRELTENRRLIDKDVYVGVMLEASARLILGKVRTFEEFSKELQYTEVLAKMPLISVEKIGEASLFHSSQTPKHHLMAFGLSEWAM